MLCKSIVYCMKLESHSFHSVTDPIKTSRWFSVVTLKLECFINRILTIMLIYLEVKFTPFPHLKQNKNKLLRDKSKVYLFVFSYCIWFKMFSISKFRITVFKMLKMCHSGTRVLYTSISADSSSNSMITFPVACLLL